ncbi:MAG: PQQ-binding-like beta-propeller repeat protein [Planctomycetota bacterium]
MKRSIVVAIVVAVSLGSVLLGPHASGQIGLIRNPPGSQSGRFIEAPRSIQQQIREAERALDDERESDAVVRLGDLLAGDSEDQVDEDLIGQDFFLEIDDSRPKGKPVTGSLLRKAREMIGGLSPAALQTYELRYGPIARKSLEEAAATRDWQAVRDVRRKYFHTLAGFDASFLLAQKELYDGHALSASLLLDDIVASSRAVAHLGNSVILMHAAACYVGGRELPEVSATGEVSVRGESIPLTEDGIAAWVTRWDRKRLDSGLANQVKEYPWYGGERNRNGSSSGQMPLSNPRWKLDTTASTKQKRTVRNVMEELTTSGKLPPPSWMPLRIGDMVLMRTTERLVGVENSTGKRIWTYPWQSTSAAFDDDESELDITDESDSNELLTQRVWNDVPYGQVSTDGKYVYMLEDLREVEFAFFSPLNMRGTRPADTGSNSLLALELETEGKLRWTLGAGSEEGGKLANAFFLGPPLPLDGRLYVMAEIAGDISLCCLDPTTGDELWRQQLVAVETGGIDTDPVRRVSGAMPTYHEGLLICPTGAGATVAIDLADRMLRWGVNYDRSTEMARNFSSSRSRNLDPNQLMQRWSVGTAVADGRNVLVTPIESDRLYGFDVLSGKALFSRKSRGYMRYLAGLRDGRFFVVGSTQMRAYDMSGEMIWTTDRDMLAAGQQVSGLGMFGPSEYMLPTTANQIIRISLEDGSVIDRRTTDYPLGNLVAVDGEIISQSATSLSVAFGESTLGPLVNRMLEEDPDNFDALVRKSELLIQEGDRDKALGLLDRARQLQPDNDEVRMLSVTAMLGKLRESETIDPELTKVLDDLIDRPTERVELLSLQIRTALEAGEIIEGTNRLLELSSLILSESMLDPSADRVINDSARQCSLDAWISARSAAIAAMANEEQLKKISEMLRNDPRNQGSTSALRRFLRHFAALDGSEVARDEMAARLREAEDYLQLERLALGKQISTDEGLQSLETDALMLLAGAYVDGKIPKDALRVIKELKNRSPEALADAISKLETGAKAQATTVEWPEKVSLKWDSRNARIRSFTITQRVTDTAMLAGTQFDGWRLISEGSNNPMSLRDPNGLLRRIPMEIGSNDTDKEAQVSGGIMVVVTPRALIGLNLHSVLRGDGEARLWRRSLSGDGEPIAERRSSITPFNDQVVRYSIKNASAGSAIPEFRLGPIMGDRVLYLQGGDLLAIDAMTAETIWRNSTAPKSGSVLCDGERVAVVSDATNEVQFFDLLDGRKLGTAPWEHGTIWAGIGQHVLAYQELEEARFFDLKLVNPFTEEVVLNHQVYGSNRSNKDEEVPCGYGRISAGRYMVHLGNDGQAIIWDIMEGREIGRPKLTAYSDLQELHLMRMGGQLLVLPKRRQKISSQSGERVQTTIGSFHKGLDGLFSVSLKDGELLWSKDFEKTWGCTLTQPADSPMLILARSPYTFSTASRRKTLDVLALNVVSGEEMIREEGRSIQPNNNQLETRQTVQSGLSRVIAQIGSEYLTYTFGGEEE